MPNYNVNDFLDWDELERLEDLEEFEEEIPIENPEMLLTIYDNNIKIIDKL